MQSKKLLIVLGSLGRGGAERVVSIISDYFCIKGWNVTIALLLSNKVDYQINEKIRIVDLSGSTASRIKRVPNWLFGIRKLVKKERPSAILSFSVRINIITQLACFGLGQSIIISERNDPYSDGRSRLVEFLTKRLYPKASAVVFQTKRAEGYFKKAKLKNAVIIANPITVECFAKEPTKGKIVTVGRLVKQKNHTMLMHAFFETLKKIPYANLFIYGEGELREQLLKLIDDLKISKHVHLMGNVLNIHEQIADAELFVLPSDYEGLSNALLEALMMGLPCISTNCAGADEYINSYINGVLVNVGDKDELANKMTELLGDGDKAKALGEEAHRNSGAFGKENVLKQWYALIDEVNR